MTDWSSTPEGWLRAPDGTVDAPGEQLRRLGTEWLTDELEPAGQWLRQIAKHFLTALCRTRALEAVAAPSEEEMARWLAEAPPMTGAEHLSRERLLEWWEALRSAVSAQVAACDSLETWLATRHPLWRLVGRLTFHLAEHKGNAERPFAFLATFTERVTESGKLQHLPLARALQRYAEAKDDAALQAVLAPVLAAAERSDLVRGWLETKQIFQPLAWVPAQAWAFLKETALFEECGIVVKVPDWWKGGRPPRPTVQVTIDAPPRTSLGADTMLRFKIDTALDGELLTAAEWLAIHRAETGLVSLRGRWVEIDRAKLDQVLAHWERVQQANAVAGLPFLTGMRFLAGIEGLATAEEDGPGGLADPREWTDVVAGKNLAARLAEWANPAAVDVPRGVTATLRPYQQQGFAWLVFLHRLGLGACLADDMGLGKTLQVIALLERLREHRAAGQSASLVVVPASLLGNWQAELAKFAPRLRAFFAHPSMTGREALDGFFSAPSAVAGEADVVFTSYALAAKKSGLESVEWEAVILDEAQAIKNAGSGQTRAMKRLRSRWRLALTGTPVENQPGDLWSLFDFLNPGLLGSAARFSELVKQLSTDKARGFAPLRRLTGPYILRRMKTDRRIIADLPEKIEVTALCGLSKRQAVIYTRLVEELRRTLANPELEGLQRQGLVLGFLTKFKQVCNHPSHWSGDGTWAAADSGKFQRLAELMHELKDRQERALVFTQYQEMCEPLATFLRGIFGRAGLILHGGTPVKKRPPLVEQFQQPDGPPFFVISVKAGGTGLNLTAASHVVHFDRWWNPAVENQATDRAFRIGQRRNVMVHKFVCQGTLEERIDRLIEEKKALASDLLGTADGAAKLLTEMSAQELVRFVSLDAAAAAL